MVPVWGEHEDNETIEQKFGSLKSETKKDVKNKALSIILGEELALSRSLGVFSLIVLADFLAFTAIYIPYTHLPPLAKELFYFHE